MSRETDQAVVEKVFGWKVKVPSEDIAWNKRFVYWDTHDRKWERISTFSSSIFDAFRVVERMRGLGWNIVLCATEKGYACDFTRGIYFEGKQVYQPSAPEAICRAAIEALDQENRK